MSTNIDDIPDPNATATQQFPSHVAAALQPADNTYIQNKDVNSNIKSEISVYREDTNHYESNKNASGKKKFNLMSGILTEQNLLLICLLLIAGQPQVNDMFMRVLPSSFHNSIIINIIKATILFILYIIIIKFIL
jgi:hypothetical protein